MKSNTTNNLLFRKLKTGSLLSLCLVAAGLNQAHGQCASTTGVKTVGTGGDYATLTAAISDLSTNGFSGSVVLELQTGYSPASETFPVTVPAFSCTAGSNTVTIRPSAAVNSMISMTATGSAIFTFNGATNVVLDGRPGGTGNTSMLTLNSNSNVILLQNNAHADTVRYLTITGNTSSSSSGMVHFGSGSSYNVVSDCILTSNTTGKPASAITSAGTAGSPNIYNLIRNNSISNFSGGSTSYGISATTNSSNWTISGNSFFQNSANGTGVTVTCINLGGDSMIVRGNYIGGNASFAGGTWVSNATATSNAQRIIGIAFTTSSSNTNAPLIDSNIITGFNFPSSYTTVSAGGCFSGIYISGNGAAGIGVNDGNLIGSMSSVDAIKVVSSGSTTQANYGAGINGIACNTSGATTVSNNQIGGLSIEGNSAAQSGVVLGIYNLNTNSGAKMTAANNIIGGTLQHSLRTGINGTTTGAGNATGIRDVSAGAGKLAANTVRNISAQGTGTNQSLAQGISLATSNSVTTTDSIINNSIYNIYCSGGNGCKGIKFETSPAFASVIGNNIHDLEQTNSNGTVGDAIHVGIFATNVASGNLTIAYNTIQRLLRTGTAPNADNTKGTIAGIVANTNVTLNAYNNTIVLDNGASGPITAGRTTLGILMSTNNNTLYNNLIKINADQQFAACLQNTAISISVPPTATLIKANNNIYSINARDSNYVYMQGTNPSSPGKAFFNCATCATTSNIVYDADFNNNCSAYKQFIKASGGRENASFMEDVAFAGGSPMPNNLQPAPAGFTYALNRGIALGYTTDALGNAVNASTPDIGAIEFNSGNTDMNAGSFLANNTGAANTVVADATSSIRINNADCELMAQLTPSGASAVTGNVTTQVWIDNTAGNYAKRHMQITPDNNSSTATATITLYYTQQDFLDYNMANPTALPMPAGTTDNGNLRIQKLSGTSSNGSGLPSSYPNATPTTITPTSVTWNADSTFWAVTFDVAGFSGFFLNTDPNPTPLPVNWISTSAALNRQKQAVISWSVSEKETVAYQIEKSTDGSSFAKLATVDSKGNGNNAYSYTEATILNGKAWYRIVQQGKDGKENYSRVMVLQNSALYGQIRIYPNPATQVLNIEIQSEAAYGIYDLQGKVVAKGILQSGKNTLDIAALAKGFYTIKIGDYNQKIVLQ